MTNSNNNETPISSLNDYSISPGVKKRLSLYLNSLLPGSDEVFETPIAKSFDLDYILSEVDMMISNCSNISPTLSDIEEEQRSKVGPRSLMKSWKERKSDLLSAFRPYGDDIPELIIPNISGSLRPISLSSASGYTKNNTNSGLPYFVRKGNVLNETIVNFEDQLNEKYPCILFTRTQEGNKTRDVYGYPFSDTLNEMRFYRPILDYQKKYSPWRTALLGPGLVDETISRMFNRKKEDDVFVSIDFSSYDKSISPKLQAYAFEFISKLYQSSYSSELQYILNRFQTIGLLTPDGVLNGYHGVPSGSTFTNEVDSIVQYLISYTFNPSIIENCQIQGDDGLYLLDKSDVKEFLNFFEQYGLTVNRDKSFTDQGFCVYLQRLYDRYYINNGFIGGIYPIYRALGRILFQERYSEFEDYGISGKDYYSIRTLSILENCKYHPCFEQFVKLIQRLDKYNLEFSNDSISSYTKFISAGSGTGGLLYNQFSDDVRGIRSFSSYKIANDLH